MIEVVKEISLYLVIAIALGYLFGWLITRTAWKNKSLEARVDDNIELKDKKIEQLEKELRKMKESYEAEIEAFLMEREDITQRYKELLAEVSTDHKEK